MRESKGNRKVAGVYGLALLAACALLSSCSGLPTSPVSGTTSDTPGAGANLETVTWNTLASVAVAKGEAKTVAGGRYSLAIVRGGLSAATQVTLSDRDPLAVDVLIGPESTVMSKAGTLTVSYAGTPGELLATQLKLWRLNAATGGWDPIAATHDLAGRKFSAKVTKFGRYQLSSDPGKAGW